MSDNARNQAIAQVESIVEMVNNLESDSDDAREAIQQDPLSVEVRSGWHTLDVQTSEPSEFRIVLCTGGPHVEIQGELDNYLEPESAVILYQDWGTQKTPLELTTEQYEAVLTYCRQFYYGE